MHEDFGSFEMREELGAEAVAQVGTFDQARDVRHDETPVIGQAHNAKIRAERGEWIVRDLGLGFGDPGNQRALAGVRIPDEADVREELQPQPEYALLAREARFGAPRRAIRRGCERRVSSASSSAARDEHAVSDVAQVGQRNQFVAMLVVDDGPRRNLEFHVRAAVTGAVGAQAVLAALRVEFWMETVGDERVLVLTGDEVDRSARTAVPAVRAAARYAHLAAEGHAAVAAVARVDLNIYFVDEHKKR